jgi:hypothetical protein
MAEDETNRNRRKKSVKFYVVEIWATVVGKKMLLLTPNRERETNIPTS